EPVPARPGSRRRRPPGCAGSRCRAPSRSRIGQETGKGGIMSTYNGTCFCGAIGIEASGAPEAMGYCHCRSCRSWSAGPVNAFTLWKPENVKVTKGQEHLRTYIGNPQSERQYCGRCGGHLMTNHPTFGLIDVY